MYKIVYPHLPGYVEAEIADANDLPDIKAVVGETELAPAPGSIAYTPGMAEIYQVDVDGVWTQI